MKIMKKQLQKIIIKKRKKNYKNDKFEFLFN